MNSVISRIAALMAVLVGGSATAQTSDPYLDVVSCSDGSTAVFCAYNRQTGHYYEIYKAEGISWPVANSAAEAMKYFADVTIKGHLATLTSSSEDALVDQMRQAALDADVGDDFKLTRPQVWVGGYQDSGSEPGGGWKWVNNEGPFPGDNEGPAYANWAVAEPNDTNGVEDHLALGRYGVDGGWNDEGSAPLTIGGYIVEYDVPRKAACSGTATNPGADCQTIEGHSLVFPAGSFAEGDTISFSAYEFTDPRVAEGTCGKESLTLFGHLTGQELIIPAYLCGSPKFVAIKVDSSDINVTQGAVAVRNQTAIVLADNDYNECNDPLAGRDPQQQDVVVWQTTNPDHMRFEWSGAGANPGAVEPFVGAAGEFTNACGSSRALVRSGSYFLVGMHVDFGVGFGPDNAAQVDAGFVALTSYKLNLLLESIAAARADNALRTGDIANKMTAQIKNAVAKINAGDAAGALTHVRKFLTFVKASNYNPAPTPLPEGYINYNGDHLMRGTNIEFTIRVKIVP